MLVISSKMADIVDIDYRRPKLYKSIYNPLADLDDSELRRYRFDSEGIEFLSD